MIVGAGRLAGWLAGRCTTEKYLVKNPLRRKQVSAVEWSGVSTQDQLTQHRQDGAYSAAAIDGRGGAGGGAAFVGA